MNENEIEALPPETGNLSSLIRLGLSSNRIRSLPDEFSQLSNLERAYLDSNELTHFPEDLSGLLRLEWLFVDDNLLTAIPASVGNIPNLSWFLASSNRISEVEPGAERSSSLTWIDLSDNQMTEVPFELSYFSELYQLSVSSNQLTTLPNGFVGNFQNLKVLHLSNNLLDQVPFDFEEAIPLLVLDLSNNRIGGALPIGLARLDNLTQLFVSGNRLTGEVDPVLKPLFDRIKAFSNDLRWNALHTQDPDFLKILEWASRGSFEGTQTIAPADLSVTDVTGSGVTLRWEPILFTDQAGGYEVFFSTQAGGPYTRFGATPDKLTSSMTVTGLSSLVEYFFVVRSFTEPHENNPNRVVSLFSEEASGTPEGVSELYYPLLLADDRSFTGLAVSSFSDRPTRIDLRAFDPTGLPILSPTNPLQLGLPPYGQVAATAGGIFGLDPLDSTVGWVRLTADHSQIAGFFRIGSLEGQDGGRAWTGLSKRLYFTRILNGDEAFRGVEATTSVSVVNPTSDVISVRFRWFPGSTEENPEESIVQSVREIPAREMIYERISELLEREVSGGYLEAVVVEGEGAIGFEWIQLNEGQTVIGLDASVESGASRLVSAQMASGEDVFSSVRFVNTTDADQELRITLISDQGEGLAEPLLLRLSSREAISVDANDLLRPEQQASKGPMPAAGQIPGGVDTTVGSLIANVSAPGVIGDVVFGDPMSVKYAAALPLEGSPYRRAVFSQVANGLGLFTGLAFFNPNSEETEIRIDVFSPGGLVTGSLEMKLPAGHRTSQLLSDLVPSTNGQVGGHVVVESTLPIIGQAMFGRFSLDFLSAVAAHRILE